MNNEQNAFVVSPHQDDAVLSLGMYLQRYDTVDVANIFTRSNSHILPGLGDDIDVISNIRKLEDEQINKNYNFHFHDAGLDDAEVRGVRWDDHWADIDDTLVESTQQFICDNLSDSSATDVYIPASFGMHPDHLISLVASLRAIGALGIESWFMYADQPYYGSPSPVRLDLHDRLSIRERINLPFHPSLKTNMLAHYPSQLTHERVHRVASTGSEYIWEGTSSQSLSGTLDRYQQSSSVFGSPAWHRASKLHYKPLKKHITHEVHSENGQRLNIPVVIDEVDINGRPLSAVRLEGAGWLDYADFTASEYFDETAWQSFVLEAENTGADILWLSGIREDSALYKALETTEHHGHLFEGESSFLLDCNKDGYTAWYTGLSQRMRSKVRRIEKKKAIIEQMGGSVTVNRVTPESIETFLNLQHVRAQTSNGKLDSFLMDDEYSDFLRELARAGELSATTIELEDTPIAMAIFHHTPGINDTVSIINQGFDTRYSHLAPGFIMQLELIKIAHNSGARAVDYLKGAESYKNDFTNRAVKLYKYLQPLQPIGDARWEDVKNFGESYVE